MVDLTIHAFPALSATCPVGQEARHWVLSKDKSLVVLQTEQMVAFKQVVQSAILQFVVFCKILLLLLVVELVALVLLDVVLFPGVGGGEVVSPPPKTLVESLQAVFPLGQTVLLQAIKVATA